MTSRIRKEDYDGSQRHIACKECRRRKLKCDGGRPMCKKCVSAGKESCEYASQFRKSGPRRGYTRELELRISHLETMLAQLPLDGPGRLSADDGPFYHSSGDRDESSSPEDVANNYTGASSSGKRQERGGISPDGESLLGSSSSKSGGGNSRELIELSIEEPMPDDDIVFELVDLFFEKFPFSAMNPQRFAASMQMRSPRQRPPVALQYAVMAVGCGFSTKYFDMGDLFYSRAIKYKNRITAEVTSSYMMTISFVQIGCLLTIYEYRAGLFPQAWLSIGQSLRAAVMLGTSSLDSRIRGPIIESRDNTIILDELRRTLFTAIASDRFASSGTSWPLALQFEDIKSYIPVDDDAYDEGRPSKCYSFEYLFDNPTVLLNFRRAHFALLVLYAELMYRASRLSTFSTIRNFDPTPRGTWMTEYKKLEHLAETFLMLIPPLNTIRDDGSTKYHGLVSLHLATQTAHLYIGRAVLMALQYSPDLAVQFNRSEVVARCVNSAVQITSIIRNTNDLRALICNPYQVVPLYTASRFFLAAARDGSAEYANLRPHFDYLLTVFRLVQEWIPMAGLFYHNILLDARAKPDGSTLDMPRACMNAFESRDDEVPRPSQPQWPQMPATQDVYDGRMFNSNMHEHKYDTSRFELGTPVAQPEAPRANKKPPPPAPQASFSSAPLVDMDTTLSPGGGVLGSVPFVSGGDGLQFDKKRLDTPSSSNLPPSQITPEILIATSAQNFSMSSPSATSSNAYPQTITGDNNESFAFEWNSSIASSELLTEILKSTEMVEMSVDF